MIRTIDAPTAKRRVHEPREIAFLDVREHGQYGEGHPFLVVPCPYSRLELLAPTVIPNASVPIVLLDDGDGVAERAARRLDVMGYGEISVVAGGAPAWAKAGYTLFKGVNVPSKTLGELVEATWHPEMLDPSELAAWQAEGRQHHFFDTRPADEHRKMTVPGARCVPNGEFAHRIAALVSDETTPIVLTCAGRTRGIVGAVGLAAAGIRNPVYALRNGTQGWALAGLPLARGQAAAPLPALDPDGVAISRARAKRMAEQSSIPWLDTAQFQTLAADRVRTLYVLDVRSMEEFAAGHLPGAVHAPGVQLVQASDQWMGAKRARVVLADDTGLRATIAAFWLEQLGYETYVLPDSDRVAASWQFSQPRPSTAHPALPPVTPEASFAQCEAGNARLIDLRPSMEHRRGRPKGAVWSIRPRLAATLADYRGAAHLIANDTEIATLAAIDLADIGIGDVSLVEGGFAAWRARGLPVKEGGCEPSDADAIDYLFFVHDRHDGNLDAARAYLAWEEQLVSQLDPAERSEFRLLR